jgi:transposase
LHGHAARSAAIPQDKDGHMTLASNVVGIDVSSSRLDGFAHQLGERRGYPNSPAGIARLVARAAELQAFVVLEATAPYDQALIRALEKAGLPFHRANPKKARDFARSAGFLAKTDRLDARMLAAYGAALPLMPTRPVGADALKLQELTARRDQLVEMRKGERTRLAAKPASLMADSLNEVIGVLDRQIRRMEAEIAALIESNPAFAADAAILRSAPGVGPVTAAILLAALPELGQISRRAVAALAGLAPLACDSGALRGTRRIWGGRKRVRDALYMAALAAIGPRRPYHAAYAKLRAAAKPFKQALIAIARKLLVALNAAVRDRKPFHAQTA